MLLSSSTTPLSAARVITEAPVPSQMSDRHPVVCLSPPVEMEGLEIMDSLMIGMMAVGLAWELGDSRSSLRRASESPGNLEDLGVDRKVRMWHASGLQNIQTFLVTSSAQESSPDSLTCL